MLILEPEGKDAENIKLGSTLSNDQLADKRFDFQFVNPPYGYEWSKDYDAVTTEAARGYVFTPGRYVDAEEVEENGEPSEEKMPRLVAKLHAEFAKSANFHDKLPTSRIVSATQRLAA